LRHSAMPLLATPELAQCDLQKDAALSFRGYCQWPDRKVGAKLTRHDSFWTGEMTPRNPEDPDLFDVTDRAQRLAKTPYCWFPIASLSIGNGRLTLSFSMRARPHRHLTIRVSFNSLFRCCKMSQDGTGTAVRNAKSNFPASVIVLVSET